jgi:hypothetical protein
LIQSIVQASGARVSYLQSEDSSDLTWPTQNVIDLVTQNKGRDLLILLEATGVKVVPITRLH